MMATSRSSALTSSPHQRQKSLLFMKTWVKVTVLILVILALVMSRILS